MEKTTEVTHCPNANPVPLCPLTVCLGMREVFEEGLYDKHSGKELAGRPRTVAHSSLPARPSRERHLAGAGLEPTITKPLRSALLSPPGKDSRCVPKRLRALPVAAWRDRKWRCPGPCAARTVPVAAELERVRAGGGQEAGLSEPSAALRDPGSSLCPQPARGRRAWVSGVVGCGGRGLGLRGGEAAVGGACVSVVCVGIRVYRRVCACTWVCMCVYVYVCMCMYLYGVCLCVPCVCVDVYACT